MATYTKNLGLKKPDGNDVPNVEDFNSNFDITDIAINSHDKNFADVFSESKKYSVGDWCIYNNILYVFIDSKSEGEWDSSKVRATTIAEHIRSLNSNIAVGKNIVQTTTANKDVSLNVTFEKPFSAAPIVVASPYASANRARVSIVDITETSFTIVAKSENTYPIEVGWIAIGK